MSEPRETVLVTGASGVLGRTLVTQLAERQDRQIVATCRRNKLGYDPGGTVVRVEGIDLTKPADLDALYTFVEDRCAAQLSIVNCVGQFPGHHHLGDYSPALAEETLSSNFLAVFNTINRFFALLTRPPGGTLLAFVSHSGYQAFPLMSAFECAKAAVCQLVKHVANEGAEAGISANALALATLDTLEERELKPFGDHAKWLQTSEIADLVVSFLDRKNSLVNGNVIHVFAHSSSYFGESYLDRIRTLPESNGEGNA